MLCLDVPADEPDGPWLVPFQNDVLQTPINPRKAAVSPLVLYTAPDLEVLKLELP